VEAGRHPLTVIEQINRVDQIGSTLFEVCVAGAAALVAVIFAVDDEAVRLASAGAGAGLLFLALAAVPDVVLGVGQPDLGEDSLRRYLRERQRHTQVAALGVLLVALAAMCVAVGVLAAELDDDPSTGYLAAAGMGGGGLLGAIAGGHIWPKELRGKD
jgi:hypothetical protein